MSVQRATASRDTAVRARADGTDPATFQPFKGRSSHTPVLCAASETPDKTPSSHTQGPAVRIIRPVPSVECSLNGRRSTLSRVGTARATAKSHVRSCDHRVMQYSRLGETGLVVSRLALGSMTFGSASNPIFASVYKVDQGGADALVGRAIDAGINYFNSADVYADGDSERMLGKAIGAR